jgi:hypothetical protein
MRNFSTSEHEAPKDSALVQGGGGAGDGLSYRRSAALN